MTKETLLKLVDAGFTKNEIMELFSDNQEATQKVEKESEDTQKAEDAQEVKEVEKESSVADEAFSKLNKAVEDFSKKLENFNVTHAEMKVENQGPEKLDDILARVLLPDGKEIK